MTKCIRRRLSLLILLLPAGYAPVILPLCAQTSPPLSHLIVLSRKQASQLALEQCQPEYPVLARVNYIQGHVRAELEVAKDGKVAQAHVVTGNPILAAATLKALRKWIYRPLKTASGPAAFLTTVEVKFSLRIHKNDTLPSQAESDLSRQVRPPVVIGRPSNPSPAALVHMRLLVNDEGRVIDSEPSPRAFGNPAAVRKTLQEWAFRPARWGTLPVPWYLEVDIPISPTALPRVVTAPTGR